MAKEIRRHRQSTEWKDEQSNAYIDLAFRNVPEPLDLEWQDLALKVFTPLIKARTETKL